MRKQEIARVIVVVDVGEHGERVDDVPAHAHIDDLPAEIVGEDAVLVLGIENEDPFSFGE